MAEHLVQEISLHLCPARRARTYIFTFTTGITSNLVAQVHSHDDLVKFFTRTKEIMTSDFSPTANQVQFNSIDHSIGNFGRRGNRGRGQNGGKYTSRCQICGQFGHRALDYRE